MEVSASVGSTNTSNHNANIAQQLELGLLQNWKFTPVPSRALLQHMPRLRLTEKERTTASPTTSGDDGTASEHAGLAKELLKVLAWQVSILEHRTVHELFNSGRSLIQRRT
eukprot:9054-Heterococcus_DN1.PRE.1